MTTARKLVTVRLPSVSAKTFLSTSETSPGIFTIPSFFVSLQRRWRTRYFLSFRHKSDRFRERTHFRSSVSGNCSLHLSVGEDGSVFCLLVSGPQEFKILCVCVMKYRANVYYLPLRFTKGQRRTNILNS